MLKCNRKLVESRRSYKEPSVPDYADTQKSSRRCMQ